MFPPDAELSELLKAVRNNPHFYRKAPLLLLACFLLVGTVIVFGSRGAARSTTLSKDGIQAQGVTETYGPHGYRVRFVARNSTSAPKRVRFVARLVSLSSRAHPRKQLAKESRIKLRSREQQTIEVDLPIPTTHRRAMPFGDASVEILRVEELNNSTPLRLPGSV